MMLVIYYDYYSSFGDASTKWTRAVMALGCSRAMIVIIPLVATRLLFSVCFSTRFLLVSVRALRACVRARMHAFVAACVRVCIFSSEVVV